MTVSSDAMLEVYLSTSIDLVRGC